MLGVTRAVLELLEAGGAGALATVVKARGSTPQVAGARLLLRADETIAGTVGGGRVEAHVLQRLRECIAGAPAELLRLDLGKDLGMSCGGSMEIFVERVDSAPRLVICGAGHVAQPTAALARAVGFEVTVVDERAELCTAERFAACKLIVKAPHEAVDELEMRADDWVLLVNYGHAVDQQSLAAFAERPHRYIGLMGSRRKVFRMLQNLAQCDALPPLENLYAPVGLDIGGVSPAEIAVSIVSELVAIRRGGKGTHLRAVDDPKLQALISK